MTVAIMRATPEHVAEVTRQSAIVNERNARKVMLQAYRESEHTWAGFIDGNIVAVWGVKRTSIISDRVFLWLLTVETIGTPFLFVRHSQLVINEMLKHYPVIEGFVAADSQVSQRWLRLLGFKIKKTEFPLYEIERRA